MIGAALMLAAQAIAPEAAAELFMDLCAAGMRNPARFEAAAARQNFARVEERGRGALYRSGDTFVTFTAGDQCKLDVRLADEGGAVRAIADVSARLDLAAPRAIAMHPPGWNRYRWPIVEGERPRFYLAARTISDQQGPVSLELSIHAGPGQ